MQERKWRSFVKHMRDWDPVERYGWHPSFGPRPCNKHGVVSVVRSTKAKELGLTVFPRYVGDSVRIILDMNVSEGTLIDTLVHEFSHVAAEGIEENGAHGDAWGVFYSRYYRRSLEFFTDATS